MVRESSGINANKFLAPEHKMFLVISHIGHDSFTHYILILILNLDEEVIRNICFKSWMQSYDESKVCNSLLLRTYLISHANMWKGNIYHTTFLIERIRENLILYFDKIILPECVCSNHDVKIILKQLNIKEKCKCTFEEGLVTLCTEEKNFLQVTFYVFLYHKRW